MADKIKVFALGGLDERGKNLYVVEVNNDIFVFDCGLSYPHKSIPGVDAIIPNCDYLYQNKNRIKAYIISHAHDDNMGALPYVYMEAPAVVVTSPFTARKIELYTKRLGLKVNYKFDYVLKSGEKDIGGRKFIFSSVTHSVPFSYAFSLITDQGQIVYTSDFIIDFNNIPDAFKMNTKELLKSTNYETLLLLADSSNANLVGYATPKYMLTPHIHDLFEMSKGRIFIACYGQNVMHINEIMSLCAKNNKTVIFAKTAIGEDYTKLFSEFKDQGFENKVKFEKFENINRVSEKDLVVLLVGEGSDLYSQVVDFANGNFSSIPLRFSENDTFVLDCPPVPNNETTYVSSIDEVYKTGCKVLKLSKKEIVTMHPCQEDIKTLLTLFKPKYYMPVNGLYSDMMANAKIALNINKKLNYSNIFVLDNGMCISGENGTLKVDYKNKIDTGDVLIDGSDIGNVGNNVIEERNRLSGDGVVIMGVTVSSKNKTIVAGPDVQMRGFVFLKDSENILHTITDLFLDQVSVYLTGYYDDTPIEDKIIDRIARYIRKETGKSPVIIPAIVDLDK